MKLTNILRFGLVLLPSFALVACGNKPPGCADAQTLNTAKGILVNNINKLLTTGEQKPDDPDGWLEKFNDGMQVQINSIVSEGYKEDAKKQMCKGTMIVTAISGETAEREVEYATQATEDKHGGFLLEIENFTPFVQTMAGHAARYYLANRWSGNWGGMYSCNGIQGSVDGPQGPFALPVTMVVSGNHAKLERTTVGGGIEKLAGTIDGTFQLSGSGENTPEDRWNTIFNVKVAGKKATAEGVIRLTDGTVLRQCQIDLTMGASPSK
jgi:hypothetical protein